MIPVRETDVTDDFYSGQDKRKDYNNNYLTKRKKHRFNVNSYSCQ